MYTWRRQDVQASLEVSVQKDIARKEWQRNQLRPVRPFAGRRVEREKCLESLAGENVRDGFLMLVARTQRVPRARRIYVIKLATKHAAPPSDSQEALRPC
jgi:hypothetical protein